MRYFLDAERFSKALADSGLPRKKLLEPLGYGDGSNSAFSHFLKTVQPRPVPKAKVPLLASLLRVTAEDIGHWETPAKIYYTQEEIEDIYKNLGPGHVVAIVSADGFKEANDAELFSAMLQLLEKGVEARYYYPKTDGNASVRDYAKLREHYLENQPAKLPLYGHQVSPDGQHLFGWNSRFIVVSCRSKDGKAVTIEHVFQYLTISARRTNGDSYPEEVWVRFEEEAALSYAKLLRRWAEPVEGVGIYRNRLASQVQVSYRQQMGSGEQLKRYRALRAAIGTSSALTHVLDDALSLWKNQRRHAGEFALVRVLDIGSGDGDVLEELIKRLHTEFVKPTDMQDASVLWRPKGALHVTTVEPAILLPEKLADILRDKATVRSDTTFEEYKSKSGGFDLIFSVHSFYLIDPSYLRKVYDLLHDDGMAVIMIAPLASNILNTICFVVDQALMARNLAKHTGGGYSEKVIYKDPLRLYGEDVEEVVHRYFSEKAVTLRKVAQPLSLVDFVSKNGRLAKLGWDAVSYFSNGSFTRGDDFRSVESQVVKACRELTKTGQVDNAEWVVVLMKSRIRELLLEQLHGVSLAART